MTVGDDPRQLVVWASKGDQERIVAAMAKLEEAAGTSDQGMLRLHRVRPQVAANLGAFIVRSFPNMQLLTNRGDDEVLVWGAPHDQDRLAALIAQMERELGHDTKREMKTYELEDVSSDEARRVLDSVVGDLEYVDNGRTDQLVIWAGAADHEQVAQLLDEMKSVMAKPQETLQVHRYEKDDIDVAASRPRCLRTIRKT